MSDQDQRPDELGGSEQPFVAHLIELRDRLPKAIAAEQGYTPTVVAAPVVSVSDEAINALLALGYKPVQASQMIAAYENQGLSVEEMIRQALRASLK